MLSNDQRSQTRNFFRQTWQKHQQQHPLEPLEKQLVALILEHPEYHRFLENGEKLANDFPAEHDSNPFLHMGMHLTLRDQIAADNPNGIRIIAEKLLQQHRDAHKVEHLMMDCLYMTLSQAIHNKQEPDLNQYLRCLHNLNNSP